MTYFSIITVTLVIYLITYLNCISTIFLLATFYSYIKIYCKFTKNFLFTLVIFHSLVKEKKTHLFKNKRLLYDLVAILFSLGKEQ